MVNSISTYSRGKVFHASYKLNFPGILLLLFLLMPSMVFSQFEGTQLNNLPAIGTGSAAYHTIYIDKNGKLYTWGDNKDGQLGDGTDFGTNAYVPVAVKTDGVLAGKKITRAAAGVYHSIVLADDGTVSAWGLNVHGQLGDGTNTDTNVPVASATTITSIESNNDSELPTNFTLEQNYPNPFNPSTTIRFSIPNTGNVSLKIYDLLGQEILTLVNEQLSAGSYNVNFNAGELTSGIYFYRIETGSFTATKKLMLVK